jgi:hypothetical protein
MALRPPVCISSADVPRPLLDPMLNGSLQTCRAFAFTFVAVLGLPLSDAAAQTEPSEPSCEAVEKTEALRAQGHYRQARVQLLECVNAQCGGDVRRRCASTLQKLDAITPSIVVRAEDASGNDVTDVAVSSGPDLLVNSLDGMAISVDPGEHVFTFQRPAEAPVTQNLTIARGEKFRAIDVKIGSRPTLALPTAASAQGDSGISSERLAAGVSLIGVGVAGLAGFTWLGLKARSHEEDLKGCKPNCSDGFVESVETRYLLANVSLGVGVAALGAAAWVLLTGSAAEAEPAQAAEGFAIGLDRQRAFAAFAGRF